MRAHPTFNDVLTKAASQRGAMPRAARLRAIWIQFPQFAADAGIPQCANVKRAYDELSIAKSPDVGVDDAAHQHFVVPKGLDEKGLQKLRRQLARKYHPDCASGTDIGAATQQMARINGLIDDALTLTGHK